MPKGVYARKQKQLERIREEYEKRNGERGTKQPTHQPLNHLSPGNGVEITTQYAQGTKRPASQLVSGYEGVNGGISDGQAIDREFYRRDGRDDEPDELTDRSLDSALSSHESGVGSVPPTPIKRPVKKKVPTVTPDKPERKQDKPERMKLVAQVMSTVEANANRERLYNTFVGAFAFIDESLQLLTGSTEKVEIWSSIDDADILVMVDRALMNAQKSVAVAQNIRKIIWLWDQVQIGTILMPRFIQTFQLLATKGFSIPGTRKAGGFYARQAQQSA